MHGSSPILLVVVRHLLVSIRFCPAPCLLFIHAAMDYFQKPFAGYNLYYGQQSPDDRGFVAYVIPGAENNIPSIGLQDALTGSYGGSFVFSAITPAINTSNAQDFINDVLDVANKVRSFIWLMDTSNISSTTTSVIQIAVDGNSTYSSAQLTLAAGLSLQLQNGLVLQLNDTTLTLDGSQSNSNIFLNGVQAQLQTTMAMLGYIDFAGSTKGCIRFSTYITLPSLCNYLQWGFQFVYPSADATNPYSSEWLPLGLPNPASDSIGFAITIDPSDVYNNAFDPCLTSTCSIPAAYAARRTYFSFTGKNLSGTSTLINSNYTTKFGASINLTPVVASVANNLPARLTITKASINPTQTTGFLMSPEGDFIMEAPSVTAADCNVMSGLSATEFFNFSQGDTMRFISRKPAYAAQYPFQSSTSGSAATGISLLTSDFTTAWATLVPQANPIQYVSQPQGASLYAVKQDIFTQTDPMLGFLPAGLNLPAADNSSCFPLVPYAQVASTVVSTAQQFEQQILSPVRKACIAKALSAQQESAIQKRKLLTDPDIIQSTSPQGFYIEVENKTGIWDVLQLAANRVEEMVNGSWVTKDYQLQFTKPGTTLQSAFQTNQLFLVMSCDADGKVIGNSFSDNVMSIEGWPFTFNIPTSNPNGIFNNVIIFKFIKNVPLTQLVQTPQQWTLPDSLNYTQGQGMKMLTEWISDYINQGCNRYTVNGDNDYQKFYSVASDPNWQGVLGLNVNIELSEFPEQLQGLLAGIDLNRFNAHHFGIDVNNVQLASGQLAMQHNSSLFGLIDYEDVVFQSYNYSVTTYQQQAPISTSSDYVFKVLSLKVLFENSAIVNFGSYLALTINKLFGETIKTYNRQNLLIFQGTYEDHNNCPVYTYNSIPPSSSQSGSSSDYILYTTSPVINDVEISNASFNTLVSQSAQGQSKTVYSAFALNGFINFCSLQGFDILSFGSESGNVIPGQGLAFSNMYIEFSFPLATPAAAAFSFDITQMSFDISQSYLRSDSLVNNFPLQLTGIVAGDASNTPSLMGYLNVQLPSLQQKQAVAGKWYALQFNLNMGTLGALTGGLGFNTVFLAAWNVGGTGSSAAIKLPGVNPQAPFFSLQGVIKVNIGSIQIDVASDAKSYLMKINNIALKLLSLSFPPGGNVNFFLFGNPNGRTAPQAVGWYGGYLKKSTSNI